MKVIGVIFLGLIALFTGGCALILVVEFFTVGDSGWLIWIAIFGGIAAACIAGIRALLRPPETPEEGEGE